VTDVERVAALEAQRAALAAELDALHGRLAELRVEQRGAAFDLAAAQAASEASAAAVAEARAELARVRTRSLRVTTGTIPTTTVMI
jgi:hypothetical protein